MHYACRSCASAHVHNHNKHYELIKVVNNTSGIVPYSRKLSREKTFTKFAIFPPSAKVSPQNSRHATSIMRPVSTFRESFLREMLLSYRSAKIFSLENFPLYSNTWLLAIHRLECKAPIESECKIPISTISRSGAERETVALNFWLISPGQPRVYKLLDTTKQHFYSIFVSPYTKADL